MSDFDAVCFDDPPGQVNAIVSAYRAHGAALLRNAMPQPIVRHYRALLRLEEDRDSADRLRPLFDRSDHDYLTRPAITELADPFGVWLARSPIATIARRLLRRDRIWRRASSSRIWFDLNESYFRETLPPDAAENPGYLAMHNDRWGAGSGGMVTVWVALTRCGDEAPSLEIVLDPNDADWRSPSLAAPPVDPTQRPDIVRDEVMAHFGADKFWRPAMDPGDILLIHHFTYHRTHFAPTMTRRRVSIECRLHGVENRGAPGLLIGRGGAVEATF